MRTLALSAVLGMAVAALLAGGEPSIDDLADDDTLRIDAYEGNQNSNPATPASSSGNENRPPFQEDRAPQCGASFTRNDLSLGCPNGDEVVITCLDGNPARLPLWRREQIDGVWGPWAMVESYTCPSDAPLRAAIEHEWTQLRPQPSDINLQPSTGWVIATVPTIAMAADAPRTHAATLLGAAVEIRATASGYRWNWGDGTHTTTTDPGRPFPNATVTHTYPHAADTATVRLTTTWSGEFRVNGGPWWPFTSTITSESDPAPLTVYDPRSRLVDCNLEGICHLAGSG